MRGDTVIVQRSDSRRLDDLELGSLDIDSMAAAMFSMLRPLCYDSGRPSDTTYEPP